MHIKNAYVSRKRTQLPDSLLFLNLPLSLCPTPFINLQRLHGTLLQSNTFSKFCQHLFSSAINNQTFLLPLDITIKFFYNLKVEFNKQFRGVAQLVARLLWEQDVGSSSLFTPTIKRVIPSGIALFIFVLNRF